MDRPGSKVNNKKVVEAVTIIKTPPLIATGVLGYIQTPKGLRALKTVRAKHIGEEAKKIFTITGLSPRRRPLTSPALSGPMTSVKRKLRRTSHR